MRIKRLISLALVLALMLTLSPLASGSHADEKKPTAEDFEIIPLESDYDDFYWFSNGLAGVKKDEKWGYINEKGKVVINIEYDRVSPFYDGLAIVQKQLDGKTKCGLINKYGKFVLPLEYNHIELKRSDLYNNSTNLYEVDKESKFGIVNHQGQPQLPSRL